MHIPDGYLAPQTTIPALAAMVPVWAVAFNKVKKKLSEKRIPALALCAAFSFVIMMFNVPVAGGSSAHAVGAVFIAILLGPWAATISVSTALLIQALVFGDGGIMAFGFNCFNMAVVMPFTGYCIYKLIAGRSKLGSSRNLAGSFVGSYVGINLAAFCASVEFGVQPLLFKAANGAALYCPYPLSVSIPSMMLAHGLIAGPIDAIITTAAIAYIAKAAPQLFAQEQVVPAEEPKVSFFKRYKAMLIPLGVLVILTPLGLIATGTAWGEWGTDEIKAAVGYIPKGFAAMADKWNALMPDYSLPALGDGTGGSVAGYILSAIVGILLIVGLILVTSALIKKFGKHNKK
jgi:cobalt/nickel transport system permease protein